MLKTQGHENKYKFIMTRSFQNNKNPEMVCSKKSAEG